MHKINAHISEAASNLVFLSTPPTVESQGQLDATTPGLAFLQTPQQQTADRVDTCVRGKRKRQEETSTTTTAVTRNRLATLRKRVNPRDAELKESQKNLANVIAERDKAIEKLKAKEKEKEGAALAEKLEKGKGKRLALVEQLEKETGKRNALLRTLENTKMEVSALHSKFEESEKNGLEILNLVDSHTEVNNKLKEDKDLLKEWNNNLTIERDKLLHKVEKLTKGKLFFKNQVKELEEQCKGAKNLEPCVGMWLEGIVNRAELKKTAAEQEEKLAEQEKKLAEQTAEINRLSQQPPQQHSYPTSLPSVPVAYPAYYAYAPSPIYGPTYGQDSRYAPPISYASASPSGGYAPFPAAGGYAPTYNSQMHYYGSQQK